jgi:hypothetical protein
VVRPIFTTPSNSFALAAMASRLVLIAGSGVLHPLRRRMCIAAGSVSFDDWDMFTSSFRMYRFFSHRATAISIARLEMTSFTFMLVCVPLRSARCEAGTGHSICRNDFIAASAMSFALSDGERLDPDSLARRPS